MTYQTNKIRFGQRKNEKFGRSADHKKATLDFSQQGVTLLLAIIILAAVLAISFSVSTILTIEVRTSGDLLRTEAAIYGVQAVTEEAIFQVKRQIPSRTYISSLGPVNLPVPSESNIATPIQQDKVAASSNTFLNTTNHYLVYDPSNSQLGSNYGHIKITYLPTGNNDPLAVYICQFDPRTPVDPSGTDPNAYTSAACTDPNPSNTYWLVNQDQLRPINSPLEWDLDPTKQQEVIIYDNSLTPSGDIYVQIESFAADRVTPKGLPYFSAIAVEVTGNNTGVTRKIRSIIPSNGR